MKRTGVTIHPKATSCRFPDEFSKSTCSKKWGFMVQAKKPRPLVPIVGYSYMKNNDNS